MKPALLSYVSRPKPPNPGTVSLICAIIAVVFALSLSIGDWLARHYEDHAFEVIGFLSLPSVALFLTAIVAAFRVLLKDTSNRRAWAAVIVCAGYLIFLGFWLLVFARGGK
jgi:hypothetical protein